MTAGAGRIEAGLFAGLLALLVWAPLPFASNRPWSAMLLTLLLALLCALWTLAWLAGRCRPQPEVWRRGRWPLALLALLQCWVLLQTVPLPREWVGLLSPLALQWHAAPGPLPLSLDPAHTRDYLLRGLGLLAGFLLTLLLVTGTRRLRLLLLTLAFSGGLQALYGVSMVLSGLELGFLVEKYAGRGAATGTFVNPNHLAGYLVICLAAGAGLLIAELEHPAPPATGWRERARRWLRYLLGPRMRLRCLLALMVVALIMTRSRAGNLAFLGSLAVAGGCLFATRHRPSGSAMAFLAGLLLVDVLLLGRWFGLDRLLARLGGTVPGAEDRLAYFPSVLEYAGSFPLTGSGGGSFYGVIPNFEPPGLGGALEHAHNDYLEFAAELGLPALALLGTVVAASAWQSWRVLRERQRGILRGAAFCCLMVICWSLLHSAVDFNLQIPANGLAYCVVLALPWICRGLPRAARSTPGPVGL